MELSQNYEKTIIDLGTGDGRFVYKNALKDPRNLYVGIDPSEKQLKTYQKKINRKKLTNARLIVGSIENLPQNLSPADKIHINLPWGTLLMHVVRPQKEIVRKLTSLLKPQGNLEIILGYTQEFEPSETERLNLPEISEDLIRNIIAPKFEEFGNLKLTSLTQLTKKDLKEIETTWSKRLGFGKDRPIFKLIFRK